MIIDSLRIDFLELLSRMFERVYLVSVCIEHMTKIRNNFTKIARWESNRLGAFLQRVDKFKIVPELEFHENLFHCFLKSGHVIAFRRSQHLKT